VCITLTIDLKGIFMLVISFWSAAGVSFPLYELCNDLINGFILWMTSLTSKEAWTGLSIGCWA